MATYTRRERVTKYVEFLIPRGDAIAEFDKAATAALREWESANGDKDAYDDWARIDADDEYVIIRFEVAA